MTDDDNTRAAVQRLLGRIAEGDPDRIAELYADDCDWRLDWPEEEHLSTATPWIRHRRTRADAVDHFRTLGEQHRPDEVATEVERVLVDGGDAVVLGEIRQTARPTGVAYRSLFALHLTFADGLVVRHHVYEDSLAVHRAFDPAREGAAPGIR